jgi:hypothetical protein
MSPNRVVGYRCAVVCDDPQAGGGRALEHAIDQHREAVEVGELGAGGDDHPNHDRAERSHGLLVVEVVDVRLHAWERNCSARAWAAELREPFGIIGVVRRIAVVLILGAVTSCATHSPEPLGLEPTDEPSAALEPMVHEPFADDAPLEPLECLPAGFVPRPPAVPTHAAEPSSGECRSIAKSLRRQLGDDLRAKWFYAQDGNRLDVDFGCERLGDIQEITLQYGGGHGGTLDLLRLRAVDEREWDVLLLRHSGGYYPEPDERGAGVWRGRVSADELAPVLARTRAALVLEAEEHIDPNQSSGGGMSSADFHAFVRLLDDQGHARDVGYTGYPSSGEQLDWQIPSLAVWPWAELIDNVQLDPAVPDADSQTFFMERFAETESANYLDWWVHERLLEMAGMHATLDLLPALGLQLCHWPDGTKTLAYGRDVVEALAAMLALLGRDEPVVVDEQGVIDPEQAIRWIAACDISCPTRE